jgi:hypothetical protein
MRCSQSDSALRATGEREARACVRVLPACHAMSCYARFCAHVIGRACKNNFKTKMRKEAIRL